MKCKEQENMLWLVKHVHFFEFHTAAARQFKCELQSWWSTRRCDEKEAINLQKRFLALCATNPVTAACGWYYREDEDTQWLQGGRSIPGLRVSRCDISAKCFEACFLAEEGLFVGMTDTGKRPISRNALLENYRASLAQELKQMETAVNDKMMGIRTGAHKKIFATVGNFTLYKALLHGILYIAALLMIPAWISVVIAVITGVVSIAQGMGDLDGLLNSLEYLPHFFGRDPAVAVGVLILVPAVLLDIKQTFWECYFGVYRRIVLSKVNRDYNRSLRLLRKMQKKVAPGTHILGNRSNNWKCAADSQCKKLGFMVPNWVRIGKNPCFSKKLSQNPFIDTFRLYPGYPRKGTGNRSRGFFGGLVRIGMLILFVSVLYPGILG